MLGPRNLTQRVSELPTLITTRKVSHFLCVPSLCAAILEGGSREQFESIKCVIAAGEECSSQVVALHARKAPGISAFFNEYGPTEATVWSTVHECGQEDLISVPIGRPIANTRVYVLDERMELAPVGVKGELYIGGAGVARGYWNRPELTAEKFVPNPYGGAGERLYRSGDVVRWRDAGELEYLGRMDEQVKIRGYRIEPGEVEAVLREHGGVREAAVVVVEEKGGGKRLLGYVVYRDGQRVESSHLRRYLQERLPEYMVPSVLLELTSMPLTANGKLDRRGLPKPDEVGQQGESGYVAPRTAMEELLCGIWSQVLGVERVSATGNFFELGGHSLLATQVIARVREVVGVEVELRLLFSAPTLEEFALGVEGTRQELGGLSVVGPVRKADGVVVCRCRMRSSGCGLSINWKVGVLRIVRFRIAVAWCARENTFTASFERSRPSPRVPSHEVSSGRWFCSARNYALMSFDA